VTLHELTILFEVGAALMALSVARKQPEYRPIALFLGVTTIANLVRLAIISHVLSPARDAMRSAGLDPAAVPFTGWPKIACDVVAGPRCSRTSCSNSSA
jgi:hypothetical protein